MSCRSNKDLHSILHPFLFVLKEGSEIQEDLLDFSLLMLKVSAPEVIPSPGTKLRKRIPSPGFLITKPSFPDASISQNDSF